MTLPGVDPAKISAYRDRLADALDAGDDRVVRAFEQWCEHVRTYHGAVFEGEGADGDGTVAARELFVDALGFHAVVCALRRAVERAVDVRVVTPGTGLGLAAVHETVDATALDPVPSSVTEVDADDLRELYERTVPARSRRVFGEYYTPPGVAELGIDATATRVDDVSTATVVDPGCGAGAFLTAALRRKRGAEMDETPEARVDRLTDTVVGIDVNPVAVAAARTAYLLALAPALATADCDRITVPVFLGDALGVGDEELTTGLEGRTAALVGNPPWIPWSRLPETQKRRLREGPIDRLDLFAYAGADARLGHANDDLSLPFVWTCLDRYLEPGGVAAFVLKRDLLRGPAGRLLRSGRVGSRSVSVGHVHDFAAVDPFDGVDASAALYLLRTDQEGSDQVSTTVWEASGCDPEFTSLSTLRETLTRTETSLLPVDPADDAGPWRRADADVDALGTCDYRIRHGLKDDAKAVFSVDESLLSRVEPTHVFPYLRSKHVVKWGLFGHDRFLVPHRRAGEDNESTLRRETPATYDYLTEHRDRLEARGSSWFDAGPFYSLFGLGPYTWASYKVVWCRLGFKPHFAVVSTVDDAALGEKPVVPGDHCMFVACDHRAEAHYLCALLNSAPYQRCLRDVAGGGKASLSKSVVSSLALPAWEGTPRQRRLADLSREAHDIVPRHTDCSKRAYNERSVPELTRVERAVDAAATRFLAER